MIRIDGLHLTKEEVVLVARQKEPVELSQGGLESILRSRARLEKIVESNQPVYGINTGFGVFSDLRIPKEDTAQLSRNLILSHAVGTGPYLLDEIVRAAMLIRANTLAKGFSGVRLQVVETLLKMLNCNLIPQIPSQGSLGSSGDLAPLSHMALVFTTDDEDDEQESGWAKYRGKILLGKEAMLRAGIPRIILGAKEGLALNNGATFSAAIATLCVVDVDYLLKIANVALALTLEAVLGCSDAFDSRIHDARGHDGQTQTSAEIRRLIEGSTLVNAARRTQDAYSLRCAPHVHGVVLETLEFVTNIVRREMNAATDNPLIFDDEVVLSGGNFHGEGLGMAMDFLGIAVSELASISERRIFRLTDERLSTGLPPMLVDNEKAAGLNSGMMMPQYTAASLVLENRTLATPDTLQSLPTSAEQEDHNANSMTAARNAFQIIENSTHVIAIELYTAARAMDLRLRVMPGLRLGKGTGAIYQQLRDHVPYQPGDAWWGPEIEKVHKLIALKQFNLPV